MRPRRPGRSARSPDMPPARAVRAWESRPTRRESPLRSRRRRPARRPGCEPRGRARRDGRCRGPLSRCDPRCARAHLAISLRIGSESASYRLHLQLGCRRCLRRSVRCARAHRCAARTDDQLGDQLVAVAPEPFGERHTAVSSVRGVVPHADASRCRDSTGTTSDRRRSRRPFLQGSARYSSGTAASAYVQYERHLVASSVPGSSSAPVGRVDAQRALPAVELERRRRVDLDVGDEHAEHHPRPIPAGDRHRVLPVNATPAPAAARSTCAFSSTTR